MIWQTATAHWIARADHCGYDGVSYCAMAEGHGAVSPFNRRVLAPFVVRNIHVDSVLHRFWMVDALSVVGAAILLGLICQRLLDAHPARLHAAVIAGALYLLNAWTWHIFVSYPALTDELAMVVLLGWLMAILRGWMAIGGVLALLAVLAREASFGPVFVAALVASWWDRRAIASVITSAVGVVWVLALPAIGPRNGIFSVIQMSLHANLGTTGRITVTLWNLAFGLGFVCLLILARPSALGSSRDRIIIVSAVLPTIILAIVGGVDVDRIVLPAFALLTPLAVAMAVEANWLWPLVFLEIASVLIWRPWNIVGASDPSFRSTFAVFDIPWAEERHRFLVDTLLSVPFVIAAIVATARVPSRRVVVP